MLHDQYTADNICRAMGLECFMDKAIADSKLGAIRLLLKPSFEPSEACLTVYRVPDATILSVIVLGEKFWTQPVPSPRRLIEYRCEVALGVEVFDGLLAKCLAANVPKPDRSIYLDGMRVDAGANVNGEMVRFSGHASYRPVTEFVKEMLAVAWPACQTVQVKNGLAQCARFIDVVYPVEAAPPAEALDMRWRMMVMGAAEDRADYFKETGQVPEGLNA